jgi:hypothetical protein
MSKSLFSFLLLITSLSMFSQITNGLVSSYDFNACNAVDGVSPRLNGIVPVQITHTSDRFGNPGAAMVFPGSQSINCGHDVKLSTPNGVTISAWIKLNSISGQQAIVSKWASTITGDQFLLMLNGNQTLFAIGSPNASANGFYGTATFTTGVWYHLVATWDPTGLHQTYVNGVLDINTTSTTFTAINSASTTTTPLHIGSQSGTGRFFNGVIDDVKIFDRKLNLNEILSLNAESYTIVDGLVSKYSFDNTTLDDEVGKSNPVSAMPSYTVDRFGNPDKAFNIVANTSQLNFHDSYDGFSAGVNGEVTHSFWVNFNQVNSGYQMILSKSADAGCGQNARQFLLRLNNNKLEITSYGTLTSGNNIAIAGQSTLVANQWYHIVLTYKGNVTTNNGIDKYSLYLNSVKETLAAGAFSGSGLGGGFFDGPACIGIGHQLKPDGTNCSSTQSLNGGFDDYLVYNKVITQHVIDSLYSVTNVSTGISNSKTNPTGIYVYPNPVKNNLNFSKQVKEILIYDVSGKLVLSNYNVTSVDLTSFSQGVYVVCLIDEKGFKSFKKIIKD